YVYHLKDRVTGSLRRSSINTQQHQSEMGEVEGGRGSMGRRRSTPTLAVLSGDVSASTHTEAEGGGHPVHSPAQPPVVTLNGEDLESTPSSAAAIATEERRDHRVKEDKEESSSPPIIQVHGENLSADITDSKDREDITYKGPAESAGLAPMVEI